MMQSITDIDIDVPDRDKVLKLFSNTPASIHSNGKIKKHNTGVYFHKVISDPFSGMCSLDHKEAEQLGYFKIDVLNVSIYKSIRDLDHMEQLLATEPMWELLYEKEFCDMLFHLHGHHDICRKMQPSNLDELSAVLALIRPAKRHLIGREWSYVMNEIWNKPSDNQYYFKRAHALSYAMAVKLHMNLLVEQLSN